MNNLLWINPEFQKNLWLELSPARLVAPPLIIGLIALALKAIDTTVDAGSMILILEIVVVLWGGRMATDSITEELASRTWDVHRLSGVSATGLVLGKFFGGTIFAWYVGGIASALSIFLLPDSRSQVIDACITGLLAQSAAFFCAIALRDRNNSRRVHNLISQAIGLFIAFGLRQAIHVASMTDTDIVWFGRTYQPDDFFNVLSAVTFAWFMVGSVRLIRRDLGFRDGPAGWSVFIVYLIVLGAGFWSIGYTPVGLSPRMMLFRETSSVMLAVAATYTALLGSPVLYSRLTRLVLSLRRGRLMDAWRELPSWVAGFLLCVGAAIATVIRYPAHAPFDVAVLGLLARDAVVVTGIRLRLTRRAESALTVYFLVAFAIGGYILKNSQWHDAIYPTLDTEFPKALLPWGEMVAAALVFLPQFTRVFRAVPIEGTETAEAFK